MAYACHDATHPTLTGSCNPPTLFILYDFLSFSCDGFPEIRNNFEIVAMAGVKAVMQVMGKTQKASGRKL